MLANRSQTAPLFSRLALRRSRVQFLVSTEGGSDFTLHDGGTISAFAGLRLAEVFEIGGGARFVTFDDPDNPGQSKSQWVGFGRMLGHFDIDAGRRVALPFGFDVGGGHPMIYVRLVAGIRFRVFDGLSLAVYPFNPTFTYTKGVGKLADQRGYDAFTFPTTFELSYAF